ncbi:MAG: carboxylesterase family protein [Acidimicrobiales bacterium]
MTARTKLVRVARVTVMAIACLAASVLPAASAAGQAGAAKASASHYYLALGDGLATGLGASSSTNDYVNLIAAHEATRYPNLQPVDLGCGGATTASMANGPGCSYTTGTQLGDAVAFLRAHPRQVTFVTIDIGAGDVAACQSPSGLNTTCAAAAINQISTDLPQELAHLKAAGSGVPIYGMNYYDPFLASWLAGTAGQSVATQSIADSDQLNALLDQIYTGAGASMADASPLFETDDTDPVGTYAGATVPQDVATVCQWTSACTSPGSIQPDDQGYAELATAFEQVIDGVSINTMGLAPGSVKTAYSAGLTAAGGYAPYKWSVVSGVLPAGLHLQAATGKIVGKPKAPGISRFTVQAVDTKDKVKPATQNSGTATLSLQVLAVPEVMPTSGKYATPQYTASQISEFAVQYSSAPDANGVISPLFMDIFVPPGAAATPRPTIVEIHGGAFVGGSRTDEDWDAQQCALYGYVGVTIDYRLASLADAGNANAPALTAAATLDAQQSVRFLKANSAAYGVDPTRIAMLGNSAGGALALASAVAAHIPYTGPLSSYSPSIAAAVSTGAFLTPGLAGLTLTDSEAPSLLFMYAYDTASHVTAAYAFETCDALRAAGNACYEVEQAGTGHTTSLTIGGQWWTSELGPFLWGQLQLSTAAH